MQSNHGKRSYNADILTKHIRAAMAEVGINASVSVIDRHIQDRQRGPDYPWTVLRENCRIQRIKASDWLRPSENGNVPKPSEQKTPLRGGTNTDNTCPVVTHLPPVAIEPEESRDTVKEEHDDALQQAIAPAATVEVIADEKNGTPFNVLNHGQVYKLYTWLDTQRDMIRNTAMSMVDLHQLLKNALKFPVTENNVRSAMSELGISLKPKPAPLPPRPLSSAELTQKLGELEAFVKSEVDTVLTELCNLSARLNEMEKRLDSQTKLA